MKVFSDCCDAAAQPDIFSFRSLSSARERIVDAIRDEVEGGPTTHSQGTARVSGENEDRSVIRRIFAPPPLPSVVRPRASHRPKHVSPDDPRADVFEATCDEVIINACFPTILAHHSLKSTRFEGPFVECKSTNPEWILKALTWTSTVPIYRHPNTVNAKLGHWLPLCSNCLHALSLAQFQCFTGPAFAPVMRSPVSRPRRHPFRAVDQNLRHIVQRNLEHPRPAVLESWRFALYDWCVVDVFTFSPPNSSFTDSAAPTKS